MNIAKQCNAEAHSWRSHPAANSADNVDIISWALENVPQKFSGNTSNNSRRDLEKQDGDVSAKRNVGKEKQNVETINKNNKQEHKNKIASF